jgi:hypothetical protein
MVSRRGPHHDGDMSVIVQVVAGWVALSLVLGAVWVVFFSARAGARREVSAPTPPTAPRTSAPVRIPAQTRGVVRVPAPRRSTSPVLHRSAR